MKTSSLSGQTISSINGYNYLLMDEIGKGGYGKVYSALNIDTNDAVAVKTLHFKNPQKPYFIQQYISRFKQEIEMGTKLHHPNIMRLLDHGALNNEEPFAVFEFVKGTTLADFILKHKTIAPVNVQMIMLQLLDALLEVHSKGIIHCDLKPQNVMLCMDGKTPVVKLFDFGSSIFVPAPDVKVNTNPSILTTAQYASPEQLRGFTPSLQSDLYAWGLILLECLSGKPVMQGASIASVMKKQLDDEEVTIPKGIFSKDLKALLNIVLQKDPQKRMENTAILKAAFSKIDFNRIIIRPDVATATIITPIDTDTGIRPLQ